MFKKILGTGAAKAVNVLTQLATLIMGTRFLGAAEWGKAFIAQTDITFLLIGIELIAGSGLVYFTPRKKLATLMKISYGWIVVVMLVYLLLFSILHLFPGFYHTIVPEGYAWLVLLMTFIYSLHEFNLNHYLGKEKVATYNWLFLMQILTQVSMMAVLIFGLNIRTAKALLYSQLSGYSLATLVGWVLLFPTLRKEGKEPLKSSFKELFHYGAFMQLSTLVSTLNKRLSLYLLNSHCNEKSIGVYASGTQVTEGVNIVGQSIGLVEFSALSNTEKQQRASLLTMRFMKLAVLLTFTALLVICLLPTSFFEWLFSGEFSDIRPVILLIAPGIVFFSAHTVLANYFSGTGKPKYNLYASLIGFTVTLISAFLLIPLLGIRGAAITTSLTYTALFVFQWVVFHKQTGSRLRQLIPEKEDFSWLKAELRGIFGNKSDTNLS
ncbi:MAG: polysaccharide biosynthesis C-terminal domain-containing protein [Bacteroidales bacterium]|nr:polysaccharide biosynthesis C-terminal domain-containing protein [Bacteroidales bacterium]